MIQENVVLVKDETNRSVEHNREPRNKSTQTDSFDKGAREFHGEKDTLHQMVLQQVDIHVQKINLGTDCGPFTKIKLKLITDLNIKHSDKTRIFHK